MVGLPGEAGPLPGLTGKEELTLSPRLVGQEGLAGVGHLGRDKREPGGPLSLCLPGAAAETRGRPPQTRDSHQDPGGLAENRVSIPALPSEVLSVL